MHIGEAVKNEGFFKKSYAAIVTIVFDGEEYYLSEISQAGGALMQWKAQRGDKAKTIIFSVVCDPDTVEDAKHILTSIFEHTPEMAAIAQSTSILVSLLDGREANSGADPSAMLATEPPVLAEFEI